MGAVSRSVRNIPAYKQKRFYVILFLSIVTTIILSLITDVFDLRSRAMESLSAIGGVSTQTPSE